MKILKTIRIQPQRLQRLPGKGTKKVISLKILKKCQKKMKISRQNETPIPGDEQEFWR